MAPSRVRIGSARGTTIDECAELCQANNRCKYYSWWATGWCEYSATCDYRDTQSHYDITIVACTTADVSDILPPEGAEFSATQAGLEVDGGPVGEPKPWATPLVAVFAVIITALIAVVLVLSFKLKDAYQRLSVRDVDAYLDKA